jgi:amyloid beta precursor protein binding protein 1
VSALRKYLDLPESENLLPLPGVLPDMKADTKSFVKLQQIYQAKARDDFKRFKGIYRTLLESVGKPADAISDEDGITFCKNAGYLTVIRGTPLEYLNDNLPGCKSIMKFSVTFVVLTPDEFDDESLLHIYVCIIAAKFYKEHHGVQEPSEADLIEEAQRVVKNMKCERVPPITEDVAKEM